MLLPVTSILYRFAVVCLWGMTVSLANAAETRNLTLQQAIKQVIEYYPSVAASAKQVESARQELQRVQGQLGWNITANAGVFHDLNGFDVPVDRAAIGANAQRQYESGSRLELSGKYTHEEADSVFSPLLINPAERSQLDLRYRVPFGRGADNVSYQQGLVRATQGESLERAAQVRNINSLVQTVIDVYYNYALASKRLQDMGLAVERAQRLMQFVQRNARLGLADEKDQLQAEAQLNNRLTQQTTLQSATRALQIELCRLSGMSADTHIVPVLDTVQADMKLDRQQIAEQLRQASAEFQAAQLQKTLAEADVSISQDERRDQLDVIVSTGARYIHGSNTTGSLSENETVAGVSLEYQFYADKKGFDAKLYQAGLRKQIAEEETRRIQVDLDYQAENYTQRIALASRAVTDSTNHVNTQMKLLEEMTRRYRTGRSDASDVILYENDYQSALLSQQINLLDYLRLVSQLDLQRGNLWDRSLLR